METQHSAAFKRRNQNMYIQNKPMNTGFTGKSDSVR